MHCPKEYINQKINVPSEVENHEFFSSNNVDIWSFKNFLLSFGDLECLSLNDVKSKKTEYINSLNSLKLLANLDRLLVTYYTDDNFKQLLNELLTPSIHLSNIQSSNIIIVGRDAKVMANEEKKRKSDQVHDDCTVSVEKNKKVYSYIRPVTTGINYNFNGPDIDKEHKAKIEDVAYIKLNEGHSCDNQYVVNQYTQNVEEQHNLYHVKKHQALIKFLEEAMEQSFEELFFWLGTYAIDANISGEEKKDIIFAKLVLADYYANCVKPKVFVNMNERTPFIECEKGLETNRYISLYHLAEGSRRRLADGVGYDAGSGYEVMLMESAGENSDGHAKENTMKLLECSIRSLKAEMEKVKSASLETFKRRRFLTCLYAKDKLTLLATFLVDSDRWGFNFVREAVIPRSWVDRHAWLRVFELFFCLKNHLDEQTEVSDQLNKEANGWVVVKQGATINDMTKM
ncbi:hypothetical protein RO3G_01390 [Rhizopus delemar RA 99-880]|uniref:Uncharacterized protein n=1 Tax=Rhizopus delemar (strain RA 99-880 / ATCC MYA-4621 / FGSC 9543 / NRRL 43880) TaxID=246409 RepID=I1BKF6_RHIO9|nr:hypothetical protein RO3G_01390 [Rhizopus delemar RA 99-880]|eukprot:EIE76686.1 hypothetical protein RO3G_01390 [Rhizopus delemar RA 99-880]